MPQYLLAVHHGDLEYAPEEMESIVANVGAWIEKIQAGGHFVFAGGLEAPADAKVVDGRGATPVMTDGPYLEAKELLGGFTVIEAPDMDTALQIAAESSRACALPVEVRKFQSE
ncbi:MAG TPA: YciI family protein [Nocardioides sp.]|nr:YciI family protein [Nocardioides sp.]